MNRLASTCKSIKLTWSDQHDSRSDRAEERKKRKAATVEKKRSAGLRKMAPKEHDSKEEKKQSRWGKTPRTGEEERQTRLSLPTLWYDKFMHSSCVCQSRPGVFAGQFLRVGRREEEGREEGGRKQREKEGRELRHWAVTAGNGLIRIGVDCVPCVDSMSPQSSGLGEEPGN